MVQMTWLPSTDNCSKDGTIKLHEWEEWGASPWTNQEGSCCGYADLPIIDYSA